jgi:hypothetical protein
MMLMLMEMPSKLKGDTEINTLIKRNILYVLSEALLSLVVKNLMLYAF